MKSKAINACQEQFRQCAKVFKIEAYRANYCNEQVPSLCRLHDLFPSVHGHNCLGCNFSESTRLVNHYLRNWRTCRTIEFSYPTYPLLLNMLVERMSVVMKMLVVPQAVVDSKFSVLTRIRRWANFLKHPRAFLFTHHPVYRFEGQRTRQKFNVVIDMGTVMKYWGANPDNWELTREMLENKHSVLVVFPDIVKLTRELCAAMDAFVVLIEESPEYRALLDDRTTIADYFNRSEEVAPEVIQS